MTQLDHETDLTTVIPRGIESREKAKKLSEKTAGLLTRLCDENLYAKKTDET